MASLSVLASHTCPQKLASQATERSSSLLSIVYLMQELVLQSVEDIGIITKESGDKSLSFLDESISM
jgi:hypothetical protein